MSTFSINGTRTSGKDVRDENTTAVVSVANNIRNTLGPRGLDKIIVDDIGEINITNDGATILKMIEVEHPVAKVLVDLAELQDKEVGDGTTSVVLIAAELIRRGNELIKNSIHPTTVIAGYKTAKKEACKFIAENLTYRVEDLEKNCLEKIAATSMSSKVIGTAKDHFSKLTVEAMKRIGQTTKHEKAEKRPKMTYNIKNVSTVKISGESIRDSARIDGVALVRNRTLSAFGMPVVLDNPRVVLIDFDLRKEKQPFNVKIVVDNPDNIESIRDEETSAIERRVSLLLDAGATLILSTRAIDEFALHQIAKKGAVALKNVSRDDLKRVAKATGARVLTSLASFDSKDCSEKVDTDSLGRAHRVYEQRVGDVAHLVVIETKEGVGAQTLLLRGPNDFAVEEVERAVHDVLCSLKRVLESNRVVVGGGVVESALCAYLENFAETIATREQLAIAEYAAALMVIPKTLATNAVMDTTDVVASLRSIHNAVIQSGKKELKNTGVNLEKSTLGNNFSAGVFEPAISKIKSIRFATEAAMAVLRIDDSIRLQKRNPQ